MLEGSTRGDRELLDAWAAGDAEAGDLFVERHFPALFRFFSRHVGVEVSDLVHNTFVACMNKREQFPASASVRAFLFGIAQKELLMAKRKFARKERALRVAAAHVSSPTSPSAKVAMQMEERLLALAVRRIPLDYQLLIEMFYWEELSIAELAVVLEVPPGTVKSRLHRARQLLRDQMESSGAAATAVEVTMSGLDHWAAKLRERGLRETDDTS